MIPSAISLCDVSPRGRILSFPGPCLYVGFIFPPSAAGCTFFRGRRHWSARPGSANGRQSGGSTRRSSRSRTYWAAARCFGLGPSLAKQGLRSVFWRAWRRRRAARRVAAGRGAQFRSRREGTVGEKNFAGPSIVGIVSNGPRVGAGLHPESWPPQSSAFPGQGPSTSQAVFTTSRLCATSNRSYRAHRICPSTSSCEHSTPASLARTIIEVQARRRGLVLRITRSPPSCRLGQSLGEAITRCASAA